MEQRDRGIVQMWLHLKAAAEIKFYALQDFMAYIVWEYQLAVTGSHLSTYFIVAGM